MKNRRKFLQTFSTGLAGSLALPNLAIESTQPAEIINLENYKADASEAFWELVKTQFILAPELRYFNNASLGAAPLYVQRATKEFRETLDGYPSKYMWGGWKEEIENTRQSVADLMGADKEEIALIHNTTEGMNLIARSFDLQSGDEVILADHEHTSGRICWEVFQDLDPAPSGSTTPFPTPTPNAAASGAVIALVIPAAKSPIARKYLEKLPNNGSKPLARSAALLISCVCIAAAEIMIHIDTIPPKITAIKVSFCA